MLESLFNNVAGLKACEYCEIFKTSWWLLQPATLFKKRLRHNRFAEGLRVTASAYKKVVASMVAIRVVAFMT